MYRILIADDEPSVLEGLKIYLSNMNLNLEICAEASDGEDAFQKIKEHNPDIVITDIRMPVYDGFMLMEKAVKEGKKPYFIVLSGYADFEYAREAMRYGARNYLLKPIEPKELKDTLEEILVEISDADTKVKENLEVIRYAANHFFSLIINERDKKKAFTKFEFITGLNGNSKFRVISAYTDNFYHSRLWKSRNKSEIIYTSICNKLSDMTDCETAVFYHGAGEFIIILKENHPLFHCSCELCQKYLSEINKEFGVSLLFFVSSVGNSAGDLIKMYSEINFLKQVYVYSHTSKIFEYDLHKDFSFNNDFLNLPFADISLALKKNQWKDLKQQLDKLFIEIRDKMPPAQMLNMYLFQLVSIVENTAVLNNIAVFEEIEDFINSIGSENIYKLREKAEIMCSIVCEKMNIEKESRCLEDEILSYVDENCVNELSMRILGEVFSVSPILISKIIKNKTGLKFNDYINKVKIEKAKKLIASTNIKISHVSDMVGYKDYAYFSNKFKQLTGVLPSDYKKVYSQ